MTSDRYYSASDIQEIQFYRVPKLLFKNPRYQGLSPAAKLLYSILRDRQELSISNGWTDESGHVYSIYAIDTKIGVDGEERIGLADLLEVDRKTVMRLKKDLVEYELLIDRRRRGQNEPNWLYVLKPEHPEVQQPQTENPSTLNITVAKSQKRTSVERSPKNGLREVPKRDSNDIDLNDTDNLYVCMGAAAESAAASNSLPDPIFESLLKHVPAHCYVTSGVPFSLEYISEIYLMLSNQFPNQLDPIVIEMACQLYFDRTCKFDGEQLVMRLDVENPTGYWRYCYDDAIKKYKATRNRKKNTVL